jgi:hypothetical protein
LSAAKNATVNFISTRCKIRRKEMRNTVKKKLSLKLAALGVALGAGMALGGTAQADLTRSGAVGLPLNPTAQMPDKGSVRVQANFSDLGNISGSDLNFGGIYAAGRLGDRLEISGGLERLNGDRFLNPLDETNVALGAKYLLKTSGADGVAIAAGVGYSRALLRNKHAYVVASKSFSSLSKTGRTPGAAHLGVRYDDFRLLGSNSGKASLYGGVEVPLDARGRIWAIGELQSKTSEFNTSRYPYSLGLRYKANGGFSATAGYLREGITGESGFYAQVGKTF